MSGPRGRGRGTVWTRCEGQKRAMRLMCRWRRLDSELCFPGLVACLDGDKGAFLVMEAGSALSIKD